MNQKRKLRKKISAWLLCVAMVLSIVNMPGFTRIAHAKEYASTVIGKVDVPMDEIVYYVGTDMDDRPGEAYIITGYTMPRGLDYEVDDSGYVHIYGTPEEDGIFEVSFSTEEYSESIHYTTRHEFTRTIKITPAVDTIIDRLEINYELEDNVPTKDAMDLNGDITRKVAYKMFSDGSADEVAWCSSTSLAYYEEPNMEGKRTQITWRGQHILDPSKYYYYIEANIRPREGYDFKHDDKGFDTKSVTFVINGVEMSGIAETRYNEPYKTIFLNIPIEFDLSDKVYSIEITNAERNVEQGSTVQFECKVNRFGDISDEVIWSVEGAKSAGTTIDSNGVLTVAADEVIGHITIQATSAVDSTVYATHGLNIMKRIGIDSVKLTPTSATAYPDSTLTFETKVDGSDILDVTWSLTGNNSGDTTITPNNKRCTLSVAKDETAKELTLKVTSVKDPTKYDIATITVEPIKDISRIEINYTVDDIYLTRKHNEVRTELEKIFDRNYYSDGTGAEVVKCDHTYFESYTGPNRTGTKKVYYSEDDTKLDPSLYYYENLRLIAQDGYDFKHEGEIFDTESVVFVVNGVEKPSIADTLYNPVWKLIDVYIPIDIKSVNKVYSVSITNTEDNVEKGSTLQLTSVVDYVGTGVDGVEWSIEGANSAGTTISADGLLTVASNESANSITVKATSTGDTSISDTKVLTIMDKLFIDSVALDKTTESTFPGSTRDFVATVVGNDAHDVVWTLTGNNSSDTTIASNNDKCTLFVGKDETAKTLTLKVTSVKDSSKSATATITVVPITIIDKVEINYTSDNIKSTCQAYELAKEIRDNLTNKNYTDGSSKNVAYCENAYLVTFASPDITGDKTIIESDNEYFIDLSKNYYVNIQLEANEGYDFKHDGTVFDTESVAFVINSVELSDVATAKYNTYWKMIDIYIPIKAICNHDFSKYVSNGDGTHKVLCEVCDDVQQGHEADACVAGADGKCTKCGAIMDGWQKIDGKWKFIKDGEAQTGWIKDAGKWYYFDANGNMKTGWVKDGGKWYYMASSGAMTTGWKQISGKWYYFGTSGVMVTGWQKISNKWYYFDDGAMVTGWKKLSNKWYYFDDGAMVTGWKKLDGKWYYFDGGAMVTGWKKLDSKWYYFGTNGVMVSNKTITIDGKKYTFNASGVWVK